MAFRKLSTNDEILLIAIIALSTAINAENNIPFKYQLPDYVVPLHYEVKMTLDFNKNLILGDCNITIHIFHQTHNITIYPMTFAIYKIILIDNIHHQKIYIPSYTFFHELNMLIIVFEEPKFLSPGRYTLKIAYLNNKLVDNEENIFESSYPDQIRNKTLTVADIQTIKTSQIFPYWNKPAFKATFSISIQHHKKYSFLSNVPVRITEYEDNNDMMWTHFDKSPFMSNAAQRLMIMLTTSDRNFILLQNVIRENHTYTTDHVQFGKQISEQVLFLEKECGIKIPKMIEFLDTQQNRSEAWKLILQSKSDNKKLNRTLRQDGMTNLIVLQMASLWYNDVFLWSKDGFVAFCGTYILNQILPHYSIMDLFVDLIKKEFLNLKIPFYINSSITSINIIETWVEINKLVLQDVKSSIVWRILQHLIPDNVFESTNHMQLNLKAAIPDDLLSIMQYVQNVINTVNKFNVNEMMDILTTEEYSILNVTSEIHNEKIKWHLSYESTSKLYRILMIYTTPRNSSKSNKNNFSWLTTQKSSHTTKKFHKDDWIIVNLQQAGYYRVNYDIENWRKLAHYLNSKYYTKIHVLKRAQIINDAFYFYMHKQLDHVTFWNLTTFLSQEKEYIAWYPMIKAFEYMACVFPIQNIPDLKIKMIELLRPLLRYIGYQESFFQNDVIKYLRQEAVRWICIFGAPECKEHAIFKLEKSLEGKSQNSVNDNNLIWKEWIYCNGLMTANDTIWSNIWSRWTSTLDNRLLKYLTCSENSYIISNFLKLTMQNEFIIKVPSNTRINIFFLIVAKHAKVGSVLTFILEHFENVTFSSNREIDEIATLIVIITHVQSSFHLQKIFNFAIYNMTMIHITQALDKKVRQRNMEYMRQLKNYDTLSNYKNDNTSKEESGYQ
nr:PREDICTED: aminopeptidase N-like [Linepithema humile]XP_012220639.1 PREDICTED: aminopeptidase N-like [Linepithema humile]